MPKGQRSGTQSEFDFLLGCRSPDSVEPLMRPGVCRDRVPAIRSFAQCLSIEQRHAPDDKKCRLHTLFVECVQDGFCVAAGRTVVERQNHLLVLQQSKRLRSRDPETRSVRRIDLGNARDAKSVGIACTRGCGLDRLVGIDRIYGTRRAARHEQHSDQGSLQETVPADRRHQTVIPDPSRLSVRPTTIARTRPQARRH